MLQDYFGFNERALALDGQAMELCREPFARLEAVRDDNQLKLLKAFTDNQMSAADLLGSTGYGLWDPGRDKLEAIFASVLGGEAALVRSQFMSGTHTLTVALFGLLRPGDVLLAAAGRPYDTLEGVIGIGKAGEGCGTLAEYGISYDEAPLTQAGAPDYALIREKAKKARVCHIQRSRGYAKRNALTASEVKGIIAAAKEGNPDVIVFVDNCYGEFTNREEPLQWGADLMAGSLIKNAGGGLARTGGYIVGRRDLVERCGHRYSAPGTGREIGCTLDMQRELYLGFWFAPGTVCEALKTAVYAQCLLELAGQQPVPAYTAEHNDIVTCFDAGSEAALVGFCQGIQAMSPVDSYAAPEPAYEPGYQDKVIMAGGSFTTGSTIELSCDGPLRAPYTCYLQGGLSFATGRAAVLTAVQNAYLREGRG